MHPQTQDSRNSVVTLDVHRPVTLRDLARVASGETKVAVAESVYSSLRRAREIVAQHTADAAPAVYGLTTGLGSLKEVRMSTAHLTAYNRAVIVDHATAVGPQASMDVTRATMFARLVALAQGGSGISLPTFSRLLDCLNAGVVPIIHTLGSVGEADLGTLAEIALVLIGEGEADYNGKRMATEMVFSHLGWQPITLQPRDALALIGTNSFSAATAGLGVFDILRDTRLAEAAGALSMVAFRANTGLLDGRVLAQKGAQTAAAAKRISDLLEGTKYVPRSIQDPLSFRCLPHVLGSLQGAATRTERAVLDEMSNALDNPLVVVTTGEMVSNGNFDATELALHVDGLRNAVYRATVMIERRTGKLLDSRFSGFRTGLALEEGHSGLDILHHTMLSLVGEAGRLAQLNAVQSGAAAEGVEDYGSFVAQSSLQLRELAYIWRLMIAIELVVSTRAVTFLEIELGAQLQALQAQVEECIRGQLTPSGQVHALVDWMNENSCTLKG